MKSVASTAVRKSIRLMLALAFALSLLTMLDGADQTAQILPLLLVSGAAVTSAILVRSRERTPAGQAHPLLLLALLLSFLPGSLFLSIDPGISAPYYATLVATFVSARVLVVRIGFRAVLVSAFHGALVGAAGLAAYMGEELILYSSQAVTEYISEVHYNLLGFTLVGYVAVFLWGSFAKGRLLSSAYLVGSLVLLYATTSRGSIFAVALAAAYLYVAGLRFGRRRSGDARRRGRVIALAVLFVAILVVFVSSGSAGVVVTAWFVEPLRLNHAYRGLDSGLTGRIDLWTAAFLSRSMLDFVFGAGLRTTREVVDNGFLVCLIEVGVLGTALLVGAYLQLIYRLWRRNRSAATQGEAVASSTMSHLIVSILLNSIVARYLLAVGNPTSLLAIFLLAADPDEIADG